MDRDFLAFCALLGSDADMVQGAGGNVSIKSGDALFIKASGMWLRDAEAKDIFVSVSRNEILRRHASQYVNLADLADARGLRPSIETVMHAIIPQRYVAHVHCVDALAGSTHSDAEKLLRQKLTAFRYALIPPLLPGMPLAQSIAQALSGCQEIDVFLLMNHGLIVAGESLDETTETLCAVRRVLALPVRAPRPVNATALRICNDIGWVIPQGDYIHAAGTDPLSAVVAAQTPLYPDHIVFLGPQMPVANQGELLSQSIARFENFFGYCPVWMLHPGSGVLVSPQCSPGALAMLDALGRVVLRLERSFEPLRGLPADVVAGLTTWEAEAYRKRLDT